MPGIVPKPKIIMEDQPSGQVTYTPNNPGYLSEVYRITVPRATVWKFRRDMPFICYIPGYETMTAATTTTTFTPTIINLATALDAKGSSRTANLNTGQWYFDVWRTDTSGHATFVSGKALGGTPKVKVTVTKNKKYDVHGILANDFQFLIAIEDPRGLGKLRYPIFEDSERIHIINQWVKDQALHLICPFPLPPDFDIVFYIKTGSTVKVRLEDPQSSTCVSNFHLRIPLFELPREAFSGDLEDKVRAKMLTLAR